MNAQPIIIRDSLTRTRDGFEILVRPNGSHSISLASIHTLRVAIDGEWAPAEQTSLALHDTEVAVPDLARHPGDLWALPHAAAVCVHGVVGPVPGTDHHLAVEVSYGVPGADDLHIDRYVTIETAA